MRVLAPFSVIDAFEEDADAFQEANPRFAVQFTFGTGAQLVDRVVAGDAAAVLVTADPAAMARAVDLGLARSARPFARNRLAIAVAAGNPKQIQSVDDLGRAGVRLALCHSSVPCGELIAETLERAGIDPGSNETGLSGRAVLARISAGAADAGIVWTTDVESVDGVEEVPLAGLDVEATYQITLLTSAIVREGAELFVNFVLSETSQEVFRSHGFLSP